MKRMILTIVAIIAAAVASAQVTTSSFGGRIVDGDGPLEGVTVVAINMRTNAQYYATTDRSGYYHILDVLPGGPYTIRINHFSYKPLTVRGVFTYIGENTAIDADLEAGTTYTRINDAATVTHVGPGLGGGVASVSREISGMLNYHPHKLNKEVEPFWLESTNQFSVNTTPFDVRQTSDFNSALVEHMAPAGSSKTSFAIFNYYTDENMNNVGAGDLAGFCLGTPLGSEDLLLYTAMEYNTGVFSGMGRLDWRINESNRLDASFGKLSDEIWGAAHMSSLFNDGHSANDVSVSFFGNGDKDLLSVGDDFTLAAGSQRFTFGAQANYRRYFTDSEWDISVYAQDQVNITRKLKMVGGVRAGFNNGFSPRLSVHYDPFGNGKIVLRGGTAVYQKTFGKGYAWKSLASVDFGLAQGFKASVEGVYAQQWEKLFVISPKNTLDSYYALTGKIEHVLANNLYMLASYTRANDYNINRVMAGFSYRFDWLQHCGTTLAVLYEGSDTVVDDIVMPWGNSIEGRISQDFYVNINGRKHNLQLMSFAKKSQVVDFLVFGLRYSL